jgi:hypothetical protein
LKNPCDDSPELFETLSSLQSPGKALSDYTLKFSGLAVILRPGFMGGENRQSAKNARRDRITLNSSLIIVDI